MSREKPLNSQAGEKGGTLCKRASHVKKDHQEGHLLSGPACTQAQMPRYAKSQSKAVWR